MKKLLITYETPEVCVVQVEMSSVIAASTEKFNVDKEEDWDE